MNIKLALQILIGAAGYVTWAIMAYFDPSIRPNFLAFNISMTVGTIGLALRDMKPAESMPPSDRQSGRALPLILMALAAASLLLLNGCASLNFAGNASYSVKPFVTDVNTGTAVCCEVVIKDGKERQSLDVHVIKDGDRYDIILSEKAVTAFQGQEIAAGASKEAIDAAAKAAATAALAPVLPALIPAAGAVMTSGTTGAVVGGAALGVAADRVLAPEKQK